MLACTGSLHWLAHHGAYVYHLTPRVFISVAPVDALHGALEGMLKGPSQACSVDLPPVKTNPARWLFFSFCFQVLKRVRDVEKEWTTAVDLHGPFARVLIDKEEFFKRAITEGAEGGYKVSVPLYVSFDYYSMSV